MPFTLGIFGFRVYDGVIWCDLMQVDLQGLRMDRKHLEVY